MRMFVSAFISLLIVSTAAGATDANDGSDVAIDSAKFAVSERLRDPGAAVFRNVSAYRAVAYGQVPQAVCGEVSTRNGFDRYNGYRTFVWLPADANMNPNLERGTVYIGGETREVLSLCRMRRAKSQRSFVPVEGQMERVRQASRSQPH